MKVLSTTLTDKYAKTFVVKNIPSSSVTSTLSFKSFLAEQLGMLHGISEVGYYLRACKELLGILEDLKFKGRGSIWCVEKTSSLTDDEMVSKPKKKKLDAKERQESVQSRFEELKKTHGTKYTSPQYRFWAEALEVGLHTSVKDPPRGRMFEGTEKNSRKPTELKELTLLSVNELSKHFYNEIRLRSQHCLAKYILYYILRLNMIHIIYCAYQM